MRPQPKSIELLKQVNQYLGQSSQVDEFTLRRWKQDALEMVKNPDLRLDGYMCKGIVASFERDVPSIHSAFKNALLIDRTNLVFHNYFTALTNAFANEDAYQVVREWRELDPSSHFVLGFYFVALETTGRFREATRILLEHPDLITASAEEDTVEDSANVGLTIAKTLKLGHLLAENDISDEDMAARFSVVDGLLRKRHISKRNLVISDLDDEGFLINHYVSMASMEEAVDLNFEITEALAEKFDDTFSYIVSFIVRPIMAAA